LIRTTGPAQPAELLLDVVELLTDFNLHYAVVGALAVSYFGVPRATADADAVLWFKGSGKSEQDLVDRLRAAEYRAQLKRGDIDDPIAGTIVVQDRHGNRVDLLLAVHGMDPEAAGRGVTAALLDSSVRIIAAEDLIAMKIFAGGPQDLEDVRGILQVSGQLLNLELLRNLTGRYGPGIENKLAALLKEFPPSVS
jgi:hypothetical protein